MEKVWQLITEIRGSASVGADQQVYCSALYATHELARREFEKQCASYKSEAPHIDLVFIKQARKTVAIYIEKINVITK